MWALCSLLSKGLLRELPSYPRDPPAAYCDRVEAAVGVGGGDQNGAAAVAAAVVGAGQAWRASPAAAASTAPVLPSPSLPVH